VPRTDWRERRGEKRREEEKERREKLMFLLVSPEERFCFPGISVILGSEECLKAR
jgi:hypothetical protein